MVHLHEIGVKDMFLPVKVNKNAKNKSLENLRLSIVWHAKRVQIA